MEKPFEELRNHSRQTREEEQNLEYQQTAGDLSFSRVLKLLALGLTCSRPRMGNRPEEPESAEEATAREPHKRVCELLGSARGVHARI